VYIGSFFILENLDNLFVGGEEGEVEEGGESMAGFTAPSWTSFLDVVDVEESDEDLEDLEGVEGVEDDDELDRELIELELELELEVEFDSDISGIFTVFLR
jgi:hypothetical protein